MTTQKSIDNWFSLRVGDIVSAHSAWGVVRRVTENATHIECEEGMYVIPHVDARTARHTIRYQIV